MSETVGFMTLLIAAVPSCLLGLLIGHSIWGDRDEKIIAELFKKGRVTIKARVARNYSVTLTRTPEVEEDKD